MQYKEASEIAGMVIDDHYTDEELKLIKREIKFLASKLGDEHTTHAATNSSGGRKKRGSGVFLDAVYCDRKYSDILLITRKLFTDPTILKFIKEREYSNPIYNLWKQTNKDTTLLQSYRNGDYYDFHYDNAIFTAITTLKFHDTYTGGHLEFRSSENTIVQFEGIHNRTIFFPSGIEHRVTEVFQKQSKNASVLDNRWSISHLIRVTD